MKSNFTYEDFEAAGFSPTTKYFSHTDEVLDTWVHLGGPAAGERALPGSTSWLQKRQEEFLKAVPVQRGVVRDRKWLEKVMQAALDSEWQFYPNE